MVFVHEKSTDTNLLELANGISKERDCGNNVDSISIDFTKAFDTVPHKLLIYKLSQYGIARFVLQLIADFVCRREMFVRVNDYTSKMHHVTSSVPLGTVLVLIFLLLHINDISKVIKH